MDAQLLTRADLSRALGLLQPLALDTSTNAELPAVHVDIDLLTVFVAELLDWPVAQVSVQRQVGRFVLVNYEPLLGKDPDALLVMEISQAAHAFHAAMQEFQDIRRDRSMGLRGWYRRAKAVARSMAGPLWRLQPTPQEADFVVRWLMGVVAMGKRINDGLPIGGSTPIPPQTTQSDSGLAPWSGWILSSGE